MDWTYVENLAYAHLVAAEKLLESAPNVAGEVIKFRSFYDMKTTTTILFYFILFIDLFLQSFIITIDFNINIVGN